MVWKPKISPEWRAQEMQSEAKRRIKALELDLKKARVELSNSTFLNRRRNRQKVIELLSEYQSLRNLSESNFTFKVSEQSTVLRKKDFSALSDSEIQSEISEMLGDI